MRTPRSVAAALPAGLGLALLFGPLTAAAQIPVARDAPPPRAPEEARKLFQLARGLRIDLVASEPLLADPTDLAFDERGRLFVCELHGYNLDGYLDIVELNRTGVLDRQVRRIPASARAKAAAAKETYGTVKLLEDSDGDGRMDRVKVWADRLPPCYGILPWRDGLLVICAPHILYLADRDGDGRAEVREVLFTGFQRALLERGINSPRLGLDNWIYVSAGGGGGTITGPRLPRPVRLGNTDFRFKPDGSALEPITGSNGTFGLAMTDFGDRFLLGTSQHALYVVPLEHRYLVRNPFVAAPAPTANAAGYDRVYPTSKPDPWRLRRSQDPAWVKFYGSHETTPSGYFTSACGQMIYRAADLPEPYRGNHFCCDPANNLIHRSLLERDGAGFKVRRAPGEEQREFLTSTDQWFRPMNLVTGPDGAIYVVDFYRAIIEDYSAIPRFLQQEYVNSLIAGHDRGRIWRIAAEGAARPVPFDLARARVDQLIDHLSHANAWRRETARRLLLQRGDRAAVAPLAELVRKGRTPQARLEALCTLDGLGALQPADVTHALGDTSYGVRVHALRLAERWLDTSAALLDRTLALRKDDDPRVRLQLAQTLGESRGLRALEGLAQLAAERGQERWMSAALLSSAGDRTDALIAALLKRTRAAPEALALLRSLASTVGARRHEGQLSRVLDTVLALDRQDRSPVPTALLDGLIEGLGRGKATALQGEAAREAVQKLLTSSSAEVRQRGLRIAGLVRLAESAAMRIAWAAAVTTASDAGRSLPERLDAVSLLGAAPWSQQLVLKNLLDPRQPVELQLAAVRALAAADHPDVAALLVAPFVTLSPRVQEAVTDALFARRDRLSGLLDAIERRTVPAASLSALRRVQLLDDSNADLRRRARVLLAGRTDDDRAAVLKRYEKVLTLTRDGQRGRLVFEKHCSKCHRLHGQGFEVGPDLAGVKNRADATLLVDLLDPSSLLTPGYTVYTVATRDGRQFTGVLTAETATSVTLRREQGASDTILRRDIEEMKASSRSMMPDGLEKELSLQDVADLIGHLREAVGTAAPGLVLFEDEPELVAALKEGGGQVALSTTDRFSGQAALRVSPPQRHSPRIAGWHHRIVEKPEPGQYRYLRFAWKSAGAYGIMLELAAGGAWPPADKPLRRYYSGKNTTGWQAVRIAPGAPAQWTVVTVDLWKDFGAFTLTGIAPTAMGGDALFDRIELLRFLPDPLSGKKR